MPNTNCSSWGKLMHRRDFMALLGAAAMLPPAAHAQQRKIYRVGVLLLGTADADSFKTQMREGLGKAGFIENQNLAFEIRSAEGRLDVLPGLAAELVGLKVDVLVALIALLLVPLAGTLPQDAAPSASDTSPDLRI